MEDATSSASDADRRYMSAAIRLSRNHVGLTHAQASVGALIVRDGVIVGRGVTARGGRPHGVNIALHEAGDLAKGATAYVTLEPGVGEGRVTPPAKALIDAGVARVVCALKHPDERLAGRGYDALREAGVEVVEDVQSQQAADVHAGYLNRIARGRPEVTVKFAVSADGMIGRLGAGQIAIYSGIARDQSHLLRAASDAILAGVGTVANDDPELTSRLEGLTDRSPIRVVLDPTARLPIRSKLALSSRSLRLLVACSPDADKVRRSSLEMVGAKLMPVELVDGRIALPELLEDLAARGISTLLVEGGATTAQAFFDEGLVDRILLFQGTAHIGADGVKAPIDPQSMPEGFRLARQARYGVDQFQEWVRI
ncbi:MAG: bifunctional diaminohydroxyphosphoribosylaminopyrimidine deaminase/5-amino-6-(5-phosphoribosylamino)uracil reductase RibD [Mesorhizobium sp.]